MRAERIVARGFRNLADLDLPLPPGGAAFVGPNGHGKTNLLELLYYPVLFRSLRGARDVEVSRHGGAGFHLTLWIAGAIRELATEFRTADRHKRVALDGAPPERLSEAIGRWSAVAFLPTDLRLVHGSASGRREYLDRVLALREPDYLRALGRYRRALAQRNGALRQQRPPVVAAFERTLATAGSELVRTRIAWTRRAEAQFAAECAGLGETAPMTLRYRGDASLADPDAWPAALARSLDRDERLGMTTVGPHRDDLELELGGRPLREFGSSGQHRTAAIALKLCEWTTLTAGSGTEPALLLDDVFAELDGDRRARLAVRLAGETNGNGVAPQTFITSPRSDELPEAFHLERLEVKHGQVSELAEPVRWVA